ncbi:MAG: 30S ribosomal protein S5 [Mycoplasmatales bacterium]|nr:30S ribosomal protein S5 [Mycoplasmatales bacterium]
MTEVKNTEVKEENVVKNATNETPKSAGTVEVRASRPTNNNNNSNNNNNRNRPRREGGPNRRRKSGRRNFRRDTEFEEKVVDVARVTTVVKGGRRFSFSVLVVMGDKKGKIGYGHGKANEVPDAIKKAIKDARQNLITVPIIDKRTVPHELTAKYISSRVMVKPAAEGRGIIASGTVRAVVELAGYKDIVTKSLGSNNKSNVVKATIKALSELRTVQQVAQLRDISPEEVLG